MDQRAPCERSRVGFRIRLKCQDARHRRNCRHKSQRALIDRPRRGAPPGCARRQSPNVTGNKIKMTITIRKQPRHRGLPPLDRNHFLNLNLLYQLPSLYSRSASGTMLRSVSVFFLNTFGHLSFVAIASPPLRLRFRFVSKYEKCIDWAGV